MTIVETPQSFVVRGECEKAAWQHGWREFEGDLNGLPGAHKLPFFDFDCGARIRVRAFPCRG
jgi:hypothetical protein